MSKFNITRIVPEGFIHTSGFLEVVDSLSWSLAALGHDVNVTQNWLSEHGEHNIIFGAECIADFQRLPPNTTVFNLEQPSHPNMGKVQRMVKESNLQVWDYSMRAVEEWKNIGVDARHVPIGYTPNLTRIPSASVQDIDVCFFGWSTPRRRELIIALEKSGLKVYASSSCYGGARDNIISRSKICLNVHHDGRDRFEAVRCSYLMANSKCVITESSADDDEYSDLRRSLSVVPYRLLFDTCISYCQDSAAHERSVMGESAMDAIQKRDFVAAVAVAISSQIQEPKPSTSSRITAHARFQRAIESGDMKDFAPWLKDHAKGTIVEIGVRDGASTSALLLGVEQHGGHVYSIDTADCSRLFAGHPQWTFIRGDSHSREVYDQVPQDIDLLLIDGDHSHNGVFSDFNAYAKWVRPGGLILFHDIAPEPNPGGVPDWPDDSVKRFYESLCASGWEHEELPGRYGMGVLHKPALVEQPQ